MLEFKILVGESLPIDATSSGAVAGGEIAPLAHETWDYPVEYAAF